MRTRIQMAKALFHTRRKVRDSFARVIHHATSVSPGVSILPATSASIQASGPSSATAAGAFPGSIIYDSTLRRYMSMKRYPTIPLLLQVLGTSDRLGLIEYDQHHGHARVPCQVVVIVEGIAGTYPPPVLARTHRSTAMLPTSDDVRLLSSWLVTIDQPLLPHTLTMLHTHQPT